MTEYGKPLQVTETPIPGLVVVDLPVHGDARGWFKENWQREKMTGLGLPDFGPVQNNISFNDAVGTTRGIHAEPWDKWVSVATGRIFGAWVDLREGPTFGAVYTTELDPSKGIFVPRGVGNSYQTLEPDTAYTYLVKGLGAFDLTQIPDVFRAVGFLGSHFCDAPATVGLAYDAQSFAVKVGIGAERRRHRRGLVRRGRRSNQAHACLLLCRARQRRWHRRTGGQRRRDA